MKVYKIVRKDGDRLWSRFFTRGKVEYFPGEWVEPRFKDSGLLVYDCLDNCKRDGPKREYEEIWECEVYKKDEVKLPESRLDIYDYDYSSDQISNMWRRKGKKIWDIWSDWPEGTLAFKKVKLVKKVDF